MHEEPVIAETGGATLAGPRRAAKACRAGCCVRSFVVVGGIVIVAVVVGIESLAGDGSVVVRRGRRVLIDVQHRGVVDDKIRRGLGGWGKVSDRNDPVVVIVVVVDNRVELVRVCVDDRGPVIFEGAAVEGCEACVSGGSVFNPAVGGNLVFDRRDGEVPVQRHPRHFGHQDTGRRPPRPVLRGVRR